MTKKKGGKAQAQRNARRAMKRHNVGSARRRKAHPVLSTNAVQQQIMGEFGNVDNFIKNLATLSEMFKSEPDLTKLRFDAGALNSKFDVTDRGVNAALRDLYADDSVMIYSEEFEGFWKQKRSELLPDLVTEEFVKECGRTFDVLLQKKRGKKKEYRAALAGKLLVESHTAALTEAPVEDNNLWELVFNVTLKQNKLELPELPPEPAEQPLAEQPAPAEPEEPQQ